MKKRLKAWENLLNQGNLDRDKGIIRGKEEQESVKRLKAHLDYCKQNSKKWK